LEANRYINTCNNHVQTIFERVHDSIHLDISSTPLFEPRGRNQRWCSIVFPQSLPLVHEQGLVSWC